MTFPRGWLLAALLTVWIAWGSTYFAIRVALESFPPFGMAAVRLTIAGALLAGFARLRGEPWPSGRALGLVAAAGVLNFVGGNGAVVWAEQSTGSGLVAILVAALPVYTAALGPCFGVPVRVDQWGGIVLGLIGVVVLNFDQGFGGGPLVTVVLTVGSLSWALGAMLAKKVPDLSAPMTSGSQMFIGGLALAALAVATHEPLPTVASARSIAAVLYLLTVGSMLAFSAYSYLLKHAPLPLATSYAYVNPVVAVLLGVGLGHEVLGANAWIGLTLVVAAVGLTMRG